MVGPATCDNIPLSLQEFIDHVAEAIAHIDARRPQAANARTGAAYQPGIGPHPETRAVELIVAELPLVAGLYGGCLSIATSYPVSRVRNVICVSASHPGGTGPSRSRCCS